MILNYSYLGLISNLESLTFTALNGLNVKRRVILSGTPIQAYIINIKDINILANVIYNLERPFRILLSAQLRQSQLLRLQE
jgi:hypothetical protein